MDRVVGALWIFRWVFQWWKELRPWAPISFCNRERERRKKDGCFFPFTVVGPRTHKGLWSSGVTGKICLLWLMKGRLGWQQQCCYDGFGSSNEEGRCEIVPVSSSFVPLFLPIASSLQLLLELFVTCFTFVVNIEGMGEGRTMILWANGLQSFLPCFHCLAR